MRRYWEQKIMMGRIPWELVKRFSMRLVGEAMSESRDFTKYRSRKKFELKHFERQLCQNSTRRYE